MNSAITCFAGFFVGIVGFFSGMMIMPLIVGVIGTALENLGIDVGIPIAIILAFAVTPLIPIVLLLRYSGVHDMLSVFLVGLVIGSIYVWISEWMR